MMRLVEIENSVNYETCRKQFADNIKQLLKKHNVKNDDLIGILGLSPSMVSKMFNGRRFLSKANIELICNRTGIQEYDFIKATILLTTFRTTSPISYEILGWNFLTPGITKHLVLYTGNWKTNVRTDVIPGMVTSTYFTRTETDINQIRQALFSYIYSIEDANKLNELLNYIIYKEEQEIDTKYIEPEFTSEV